MSGREAGRAELPTPEWKIDAPIVFALGWVSDGASWFQEAFPKRCLETSLAENVARKGEGKHL